MRLLLIRHGDPDYEHDTLTARGEREAQLLSRRMAKEPVSAFYVSPLGRAKKTASYTLEAVGREAETQEWLREFPAIVDLNRCPQLYAAYPDTEKNPDGTFRGRITWDMTPSYMAEHPEYCTENGWRTSLVAKHSDMEEVYDRVCAGLDGLLEKYGYRREGRLYRTREGSDETLVFFCHFGVTCVLLSHLFGVSPFILWHSLCMAPSSVTEVWTEEREEGKVSFRASRVGDLSHLDAAGVEPSFSARFCSCYKHTDERH